MKIDPPASLRHEVIDPTRSRKLLLNKKEIKQLSETIEQKSLTCVLTSVYWKENHIKCDLSIGKVKNIGTKGRILRQETGKGIRAEFLKMLKTAAILLNISSNTV